jgi:hypothetical protein
VLFEVAATTSTAARRLTGETVVELGVGDADGFGVAVTVLTATTVLTAMADLPTDLLGAALGVDFAG